MGVKLLMIGCHKGPIATGLVYVQNVASFNKIGQKVEKKLHSQKLGNNRTDRQRYEHSQI